MGGMTTLPCILATPSPPARACATSLSRAGSSGGAGCDRASCKARCRLRPSSGWRLAARPGGRAQPQADRSCHRRRHRPRDHARVDRGGASSLHRSRCLKAVEARRLIVEDNAVRGVLAASERGPVTIATDRVVIATGGIGGLFLDSTNPAGCFGQGIALAAHAGAKLSDLEFIQFHPTAFDGPSRPMPLLTEAIRGDGAILIDETGQRFMADHPGRRTCAARRRGARGLAPPRRRTSGLPRRANASGQDFAQRYPVISAFCRMAGIDPADRSDPGTARGALSHGRHCRGY